MEEMKKTEEEILKLGRLIARNYRIIVTVGAFLYGCFIFVNTQNQHSQAILSIQNQHSHDIAELKTITTALKERIENNEKNFGKISTKLDTTLERMSNDLQFIKQKLIERGMQ